MSRLLNNALNSSEDDSAMSLESALAEVGIDQMEMSDGEVTVNTISMELETTDEAIASLESMYAKLSEEAQSEQGISSQSLESSRSTLIAYFGEDVLYHGQSLESIDNLDELSLEGIKEVLSKLNKYREKKYDELKQSLSWMHSRFMGGFKKTEKFFKAAGSAVKKIPRDGKAEKDFKPSKSAVENLHVDGSMSVNDVVSSLNTLNGLNGSLAKEVPGAVKKAKGLADKAEKEVMSIIDSADNRKDLEEKLNKHFEKYQSDVEKAMSGLSKVSGSVKGKKFPGGREGKSKDENGMTVSYMEKTSEPKGDPELPDAGELSKLIKAFEETLSIAQEYQKPASLITDMISEAQEAEVSSESSQEGMSDAQRERIIFWARAYLIVIALAFVVGFLTAATGSMAILTVAAPILNIAGGVSFIGLIVSAIAGLVFPKGKKEGSTESNEPSEYSDESVDLNIDKKVTKQAVKILHDLVKYQNTIAKSGATYVNDVLKAYGVDGKEPE